ncbi:MAG: WD40/YVTN/BNR-like repeat-containing protein [Rhodanobacteraceae bacterium]
MKARSVAAFLGLIVAGGALAATPPTPTGPFANLKFRNLGPSVSGGRVSTVTGIPGKPDIYYVGTAGGGLWKTTDDGIKWKNIFEHEGSASIGAVALVPSNDKAIWVGTGEANPRNDVLVGHGVYYSADDGKTWQFKGLADAGLISKIIVDPNNADTVYVAVQGNPWKPSETRGVFMTTDAGKTWNKVLYVNDTTGASDIAMDPSNPNVLYAGMWTEQRKPWTQVNGSTDGGIWRSQDGGKTWNKLGNGLPTRDATDRVNIAIAPSAPDTIYALMPTQKCMLWGSTDGGDKWDCVSNNHELAVRMFYFSAMAVAPDNPKTIYFSSFNLMKSTDGGKTAKVIDRGVHVDHHAIWVDPKNPKRLIQGNDGGAFESVDGGKSWRSFNNMPIEEFYTVAISNTVPFGVCGGIQDDNAACGPSNSLAGSGIWGADWWNPSGGDGTYVVPAPSDPTIVYAASQNGSTSRIDMHDMTRHYVRPVMEDMSDTPISKLDYRFNWASPIAVSATDPNTLYLGANVVFKSTDGGANWQTISNDLTRNLKEHQPVAGDPVFHDISSAENTDTILSISLAPTDPNVIWVGTDDGLVWVSKDGGANWTNVSTGLPQAVSLGRIYQIGVSPFAAGTAYLAVDGHMLGDEHPYVLKTTDFGAHWQGISNGLPDNYAAVVVREDPNRKGLLALGTMRGLYLSFDDGAHWEPMTGNLPTMAVWDIKFTKSPHDLVMATHGRGLWILDNIEALEQWQPKLANDAFHLFPAAQGTEWLEFGGRHIGPAPGEFKTPNPPSGPVIAYSLAKAINVPKACSAEEKKKENGDESAQESAAPALHGDTQQKGARKANTEKKKAPAFNECNPVVITVTDSAGKPVASFHAPGKAGINVASWNMRYEGVELPEALRAEERPDENHGPKGPLALPGTYQVKVQANGRSATETVQVVADPRVNPPMDVQRAAFDTAMKLRDEAAADVAMIGRAYDTMQALDKVLDSTASAQAGSDKANVHASAVALKEQLGDFAADIYNPDIQYKVPEDDLHQLSPWAMSFFGVYRGVSRMGPDQAPNARQQQYIAKMEAGLQPKLDTFNGSLHQAVVNFNQQAKKAGVQTLPVSEPVKIGDPKLLAPAE